MRIRLWVLGEFSSPERMLEALRELKTKGFRQLDSYSPHPVEGVGEILRLGRSLVPLVAASIGFSVAAAAYWLQWFGNGYDYAINVGNRPMFSAPTQVPFAYELGILSAAFGIFFALWAIFRWPRPHHPVMEAPGFERATLSSYWVSVTTILPNEAELAVEALRELGASEVSVVKEKVDR